MCYSATASFAAGAALIPAGIYCITSALRRAPRFLPLALVPFGFALQQCSEGFVWLGLNHDHPYLVQNASVAYLFFALAFWPFWIPLCFLCTEKRPGLQWLLGAMTLTSLAWAWLYSPILLDPNQWLRTEVVHHSIRYDMEVLPGYSFAPRSAWRLGYLALVAVPLLIGANREQPSARDKAVSMAAAFALVALFIVTYCLYAEVFVSLWCFFAALLALMLTYVFYQLPATGPALAPSATVTLHT